MVDMHVYMTDCSVAIAAITSCTNTSNPSVMVAAGLLAKHAVERGLSVKQTVKTSLAPGSRAVIDYLNNAELLPYLEALRFHLVGYGCTTCIAQGTPVLLANGTARPIEQMPRAGGARLLGHLLSDGSISLLGQGRMHVGQAMDREAVLEDVELLTGSRHAATRYDERKWTIVLPKPLTDAISTLPGVRTGRRIQQAPALPAFVLAENCPRAVVREFLGGLFGADGHAPVLHRWGEREEEATLESPAYSQSTISGHVEALKQIMDDMTRLLARCGVKTDGANVYEYPTRRATSSYPTAQDGIPQVEVRLELPDGLSFVERVGFRYCMDKALRASAAAVYWRLVNQMHLQRFWMSDRLEELHQADYELSFSRARKTAAVELMEREAVVFPHYALLEGHDRFSRLPQSTARKFQPLHRDSCDFPSPIELFSKIGVREWFAPLRSRADAETSKRYCFEKEARTLPTFALQVVERRSAGRRAVFDLAVNDLHAFVAGTVAVHNCIGNSCPLPEPVAEAVQDKYI